MRFSFKCLILFLCGFSLSFSQSSSSFRKISYKQSNLYYFDGHKSGFRKNSVLIKADSLARLRPVEELGYLISDIRYYDKRKRRSGAFGVPFLLLGLVEAGAGRQTMRSLSSSQNESDDGKAVFILGCLTTFIGVSLEVRSIIFAVRSKKKFRKAISVYNKNV